MNSLRPCAERLSVITVSLALALLSRDVHADNTLHITTAQSDRPTVVALGVQVLISGDDNFNAAIGVRYRVMGGSNWQTAQSLFRVHPEVVTGATVPTQFAGSIFDLNPDTPYEIELHATDPDGAVDNTMMLTARTRAVPRANPAAPHTVSVTDAASLSSALGSAHPGDVITLANGTYSGTWSLGVSGTADNPIYLRGASEDGVILDGGNCVGCNVIEVYGSYVTIESLTIQNAERAIRFQTPASTNNVMRHVHIRDVTLAVNGHGGQLDYYLCDNIAEGRLHWPTTYATDMQAHSNDDGLVVTGDGMVVCHNRISGFADSIQNSAMLSRSNDFYGNDSIWNYDDGIELDGMAGNARAFRNRWTNTYDAISGIL